MFVTINYISCTDGYRERFEYLFKSRAKAIDRVPGFRYMQVLKPVAKNDEYLVISHWDSEADFEKWKGSPEFLEGHRRGFEDMKNARAEGTTPPMNSNFKTYHVLAE